MHKWGKDSSLFIYSTFLKIIIVAKSVTVLKHLSLIIFVCDIVLVVGIEYFELRIHYIILIVHFWA